MGVRAILRDLLSLYLGYEILRGYFFGNFVLTSTVAIAAAALFVLAIWFLLERIGLLPKLTK